MSEEVSQTILVIDDDEPIRGLFEAILQSSGYRTISSRNGKDGLKQIRRKLVTLMITDLVMPEQEGLETISVARREFPHLKILVVSGYEEYFKAAMLCGAHDCMLKPVTPDALLSKVGAMVGGLSS